MTIAEILNKLACGLAQILGTGLAFCKFNFKQPKTIALIQKGYKFLPGDDFDLAAIKELQQRGKAIILQGVTDFVDNTPDNDRRTFGATGKMTTTLKHPYLWTFTFDNGLQFYKAVVALESNEEYDIILFDVMGNALLAKDPQGNGRGLDLGLFDTGKYVIGNENSETITVQVDRYNFDSQVAWIEAANLDFNAGQDLDGYNDLAIVMIAPANAATTIDFSVHVGDGTASGTPKLVALEGLAASDLLLQKTVAGVTTTVTKTMAAGAVAGEYVLTVPAVATGDVYTLRTNDAVLVPPTEIIDLDGVLYKSNTASTIVV